MYKGNSQNECVSTICVTQMNINIYYIVLLMKNKVQKEIVCSEFFHQNNYGENAEIRNYT